jgi:excisionase family DNA binding protein
MSKILELQELGCKSTRETAKILQVSLGTIQKMVETGELVAWKTRGGHRRILDQSIERQLEKRLNLLRHFTSKHYSILGIFKEPEDIEPFESNCLMFESSIQMTCLLDISEALMKSVEIKPDIIYIDRKINYINQFHLIHHLNKNTITSEIPILIYKDSLEEMNPLRVKECEEAILEVNSPKKSQNIYEYSDQFETIGNLIKSALFKKVL